MQEPKSIKRKGVNWKLREKRREQVTSLGGYPLSIRVKPTAHKQFCYNCRRLIEKQDLQVVMPGGMWIKYKDSSCKSIELGSKGVRLGGHSRGTRLFQRYVYLHSHCFGCVTKKLFAKAGTSLIPNCEDCKQRFNCYTNNIDDLNQGPYLPSRPPLIEVEEGVYENQQLSR